MTDRIERIKAYQWERRHHAARKALPEDLPRLFRKLNGLTGMRAEEMLTRRLDVLKAAE